MPPTSHAQQKVLVAQFVSLTGGTERQASRYLKSTGFKINDAVDARDPGFGKLLIPLRTGMMGWAEVKRTFPSKVPLWPSSRKARDRHPAREKIKDLARAKDECYYAAGHGTKAASSVESKLGSLFDSLRSDENDDKNKLELDSTMAYLGDQVAINLENAELFVILELLQAPSVGEITRKGFVDGWKTAGAGVTHREHSAHAAKLISTLATDVTLYKRVYRYAFIAGRERDQKALSLENALVYWGMLFSPPGIAWKTRGHDWLALWRSFLDDKWTRSVNKDMWNITLEFALKTLADESLSFWTEDSAWPSVIDDFVSWCREKGIGKAESMDVDADA